MYENLKNGENKAKSSEKKKKVDLQRRKEKKETN